jgi:hypothetical protein
MTTCLEIAAVDHQVSGIRYQVSGPRAQQDSAALDVGFQANVYGASQAMVDSVIAARRAWSNAAAA